MLELKFWAVKFETVAKWDTLTLHSDLTAQKLNFGTESSWKHENSTFQRGALAICNSFKLEESTISAGMYLVSVPFEDICY